MKLFKSIITILTLFAFAGLAACSTMNMKDSDSGFYEESGSKKNKRTRTGKSSDEETLSYFEKGEYEEDVSARAEVQRKVHWSKKYTGVSGFLKRPPLFSSNAEAKKYNRCMPIKIVRFNEAPGEVTMLATQEGRHIKIVGLNRNLFTLSSGKRLPDIDRHFVKNLEVIHESRKLARATNYLCKGQAWKYMTREQFLFINGKPDKVLKGKGKYSKTYQWIYKNGNRSEKKSYYFTNGLLWAWN